MIEGIVNIRYEAVVALTLQGPQGKARDIEAVIDTGYNGFLTLSTALVTELELPFITTGRANLANDEEVEFGIHEARVLWDGQARDVEAAVAGSTPLIGIRLLDRHNLTIEVEVGGRVNIQSRE